MWTFSISYSKVIAWKTKTKQRELENKLKILEKPLFCDKNVEEYHKWQAELDEIYDNIAERVKISSRRQ